MQDLITLMAPALTYGLIAIAFLAFLVAPVAMAENRNRNSLAWLFLTLALSPMVTIPALFLIGNKQ